MDSARKALDALSVPPDQRWEPATWVDDDGEWVARGPLRMNRNPPREPGESDDEYEARCFDEDDGQEPGCDGDQQAHDDAARMCLSVNLSAPLAAVVRAAMDWRETADAFDADFSLDSAAKLNDSEDALRAALDAFNDAALAQWFQP